MFCVPPFSNTYKITPWGILWHKVVLRVQKQSCPRGLGAVAASVSRLAGHTPNHQGSPARQPITRTPLVNYTSFFLPLCQSLTLSFSSSLSPLFRLSFTFAFTPSVSLIFTLFSLCPGFDPLLPPPINYSKKLTAEETD